MYCVIMGFIWQILMIINQLVLLYYFDKVFEDKCVEFEVKFKVII